MNLRTHLGRWVWSDEERTGIEIPGRLLSMERKYLMLGVNSHHPECREDKVPEHNHPTPWWAGEERMVKMRQKQHLDRSEDNRKTTDISYKLLQESPYQGSSQQHYQMLRTNQVM